MPGHLLSAIDDATIQQSLEDRCETECQLVRGVKISVGSVNKIILANMNMGKVSAQCIPWLLTPLQRKERIKWAKAHLTMYEDK